MGLASSRDSTTQTPLASAGGVYSWFPTCFGFIDRGHFVRDTNPLRTHRHESRTDSALTTKDTPTCARWLVAVYCLGCDPLCR